MGNKRSVGTSLSLGGRSFTYKIHSYFYYSFTVQVQAEEMFLFDDEKEYNHHQLQEALIAGCSAIR